MKITKNDLEDLVKNYFNNNFNIIKGPSYSCRKNSMTIDYDTELYNLFYKSEEFNLTILMYNNEDDIIFVDFPIYLNNKKINMSYTEFNTLQDIKDFIELKNKDDYNIFTKFIDSHNI